MLDNTKIMKKEKGRLEKALDGVEREFELNDDLITLVLKAKMQGNVGKVSKEFMMELEELTNSSFKQEVGERLRTHFSKIQADAKGIVVGEMLK